MSVNAPSRFAPQSLAAGRVAARAAAATILVVDDDPDLREALCDTLELARFGVLEACSGEEALTLLARQPEVALVVSDVNMGGMDGHQLLREIKRLYPQIPVVLNTAYGTINRSVEAMRDGAVDYLVKPFVPSVLVETVNRYVSSVPVSADIIANDPASQQLLQLARRVAESDSTVLIMGESGTGKEVLARYIHTHSPRAEQAFVAINCAAIPENMLEAMLFGHEKGAYTGAVSSAPGKFEQANGGTILLDEISEMDLGLQAKLLRVLQEREVERLGGRKTIPLDVRVIATSNRDMRRQVAEGKFREDLYFRLSVLPLQWAPLRDRPADILPLATTLLQRHARKQHRKGVTLTDSATRALLSYSWPGNVRELDNVMQRALILQPGSRILSEDLGLCGGMTFSAKPSLLDAAERMLQPVALTPAPGAGVAISAAAGAAIFSAVPGADISGDSAGSVRAVTSPDSGADDGSDGGGLGDDLKQREFEIILSTLRQERGSKKNTAARLGISARTLRYKMARFKELGLDLQGFSCN